MAILTIAIPTYNRNALLLNAIKRLAPQLTSDHRLLIVDNCSDIPVSDTIGEWIGEFSLDIIKIVRNNVNIGGGANILRCLELCETEWMYCLGDDDLVTMDCLDTISQEIFEHPDCLYISFSRKEYIRNSKKISTGLAEFVKTLDDWPTFLFMSSSVINSRILRKKIQTSYLNLYSWAPLQVALLQSLNSSEKVVFSNGIICDEISLADTTWNPLIVAAGKMILPDLIRNRAERKRFAKKIAERPAITFLAYFAAVSEINTENNRYLFNIFLSRCRLNRVGNIKIMYGFVLSMLLLLPTKARKVLFSLVPVCMGRLGRPLGKIKVDVDRA